MDRDAFIKYVRSQLAAAKKQVNEPGAVIPTVIEPVIRQVAAASPDLVDRWMQRATSNGMAVAKIQTEQIPGKVQECLALHQARRVMVVAGFFQNAVSSSLQNAGLAIDLWQSPESRQIAYETDASVTDCRYATADSGSLVVWSDSNFGRCVTLTMPVHVVIVPASRIIADMVDLPARFSERGGALPSNVVIISGPSKTADIEMKLVTGVHGPKHVYALLVTDA